MTDINQGQGGADALSPNGGGPAPGPAIRVLAQFIRDLSFENPRAPDALNLGSEAPQMDVGVEMSARGRPDGLFEVDLKVATTAQREGATVFHCELVYGGLFQISGVGEQDMELVLMSECPRFLFPFVRQIVHEMSVQGGFPPFLLDPIDFMGLYLAQRAQAGGAVTGQA